MIENIPVVLNFDFERLIGKGHIKDGVLVIEVNADQVVREIEKLATIDHIQAVSLGFSYTATINTISIKD